MNDKHRMEMTTDQHGRTRLTIRMLEWDDPATFVRDDVGWQRVDGGVKRELDASELAVLAILNNARDALVALCEEDRWSEPDE